MARVSDKLGQRADLCSRLGTCPLTFSLDSWCKALVHGGAEQRGSGGDDLPSGTRLVDGGGGCHSRAHFAHQGRRDIDN